MKWKRQTYLTSGGLDLLLELHQCLLDFFHFVQAVFVEEILKKFRSGGGCNRNLLAIIFLIIVCNFSLRKYGGLDDLYQIIALNFKWTQNVGAGKLYVPGLLFGTLICCDLASS